MSQDTTKITIPLADLEREVGKIEVAEADEDVRGDLILLKGEGFMITLTRNNVQPYYLDGPLPDGKMIPVIDGGNLVITFR